MHDRRRPLEHVALELAALRIEHDFQANLILRMADALFMSPLERDLLAILASERTEVAAFAAGLSCPDEWMQPSTKPRGRPPLQR